MDSLLNGQCLCGNCHISLPSHAVRFGFASCHCSRCRLAHSSPFVLWSGVNKSLNKLFEIKTKELNSVSCFKSTSLCSRYFCSICGTHVYIKYDETDTTSLTNSSNSNSESISNASVNPSWMGEIHFPTALLDETSIQKLEIYMAELQKPRYLHVFLSDRTSCLGDFNNWANGPKHGGLTGLEQMESMPPPK